MRLNDTITPGRGFFTESREFLQRIIDEINYNPPPPVSKVPEYRTDENQLEFFERYYVPLDSRGHVPSDCEIEGLTLSSYEQRVIDFCTNPRSETRICVLHGHTGVGKSSLLRRVIYYVYPNCPGLKKAFKPIYLRLTSALVDENPDVLYRTVVRVICDSTYEFIRDELETNTRELLWNLNLRGKYHGRFPISQIEKAEKDEVEVWLNDWFVDGDRRRDFLLHVLSRMIRSRKIRVILIVDDVDRHSQEIHNCTFLVLDRLATLGFAAVVSMRTSTFESASTQLLEYRDQRIELGLNPELIEQILMRRVRTVEESVRLEPETPFRIADYEEVSGKDVVDCFCALVSRSPCMKALISLSNTNLKSVFLKMDLMSKSEAFSDKFLVHQLLIRDVVPPEKRGASKIWVFYHLLLGNYAGTYRRDPEARKAGLINAFDSSEPSDNPWRHFIRINLLLYLYKMWRLTRDESEYMPVSELHEKFKRAFGTVVDMSLLLDAIWALIESELVFMGSCFKYDKESVIQRVFSDSMRISTAGAFYIENLLHKVEYLYFVKDDIDWKVDELPRFLTPASRDYQRRAKFGASLQALRLLLEAEYSCLRDLRAFWSGSESGEDAISRYREHFSPYSLAPGSAISICEVILGNYKRFMQQVMGSSFPDSLVSELIDELEEIKEENESTKRAYIQA